MKRVDEMYTGQFNELILYRDILRDEIIDKALFLILNHNEKNGIQNQLKNQYFELQSLLVKAMSMNSYNGTMWQGYFAEIIGGSENAFSIASERGVREEYLTAIAKKELKILQALYGYDWSMMADRYNDLNTSVMCVKSQKQNEKRKDLHLILGDQEGIYGIDDLANNYFKNGCGLFEKYCAFKWDTNNGLIGIKHYDEVSFSDLTGYIPQKNQLIENTTFFLKGMRANNVLLYGDKGTGKSSSVKALLDYFKDSKLKMIEVSKEQFYSFPEIIKIVENRGYHFIIFIDDLSFEEFETEYKYFKAILEGGLETRPSNVVIYVTSNRRNLIKETWNDQAEISNDIHISDSVQEKTSLVDRFGITITFPSPDKNLFLQMVLDLAKKEQINICKEELCSEALKWEMRYHGRSGRSARQFIDYMNTKTNSIAE